MSVGNITLENALALTKVDVSTPCDQPGTFLMQQARMHQKLCVRIFIAALFLKEKERKKEREKERKKEREREREREGGREGGRKEGRKEGRKGVPSFVAQWKQI